MSFEQTNYRAYQDCTSSPEKIREPNSRGELIWEALAVDEGAMNKDSRAKQGGNDASLENQ